MLRVVSKDYGGFKPYKGTLGKRKKSGEGSLKEMKGVKETVYLDRDFLKSSKCSYKQSMGISSLI